MEKILFVIIILMVNCSGIKSQSKDNELKHRFKIIKIDSTKTMYLIQVQNENIKEVIITEKECKSKDKLNKKNSSRKWIPVKSWFTGFIF